nr:heat shock 70 kDa protein cognate 4 [Paroster macrosturtensis]
MAAMSVIGIDFGNESCYIAVAKAGGIETIANDYSLRATPSYVAFSQKNRILGVAAKNQQVTNMKNTVYYLKRLLGRRFNDSHVQREMKFVPFNVIPTQDGSIGIKVNYLGEEHIFTPEQCIAMLLTKLKEISANALQTQINDCVISVPSYYTNTERKALLDAANISGLNVLRLMNETTATALAYGIYKQDLPAPEEKPRNVIFVDCGHSSLQVSACAFNKGKLRMIATASDEHLGGRNIDLILADHICKDFQTRYKIDAKSNQRAFIRLLAEVEKLKKQMSANSTMLPLNIECFMDDKDVHALMKREEMEHLCTDLFHRVEICLRNCLEQSKLRAEEIHSVEVVGGSTRIPALKHIIEKVFNRTASTTLNQDEAVSRGCALQCAMLSPAVRVREFSISDVQTYPVNLAWEVSMGEEGQGEMEVFPINHPVPFSKMLTFYRREPFQLRAFYGSDIPYPDRMIGQWLVKDIKPTPDGESQKIKVKVRINIHGLFNVASASLYERKDTLEEDGPDNNVENNSEGEKQNESTPMNEATEDNTEGSDKKDKDKKKKQLVKAIELPIECATAGFSQVTLNSYIEEECKMIAADRQEKERADARNALEEYVYELRGKLSSEDELATFVTDSDRSSLISQLDQMENWLYEDGEDCNRPEYHERLMSLKTKGEPIQNRRNEFDLRPRVLEDFARSIQLAGKASEQMRQKDPKYEHVTDEEVMKLIKTVQENHKWLEETRVQLNATSRYVTPSITVSQIRTEHMNFEQTIRPILNKPIPKPPSPPKEDKSANEVPQENGQTQPEQQQDHKQNEQQTEEENSKMEWTH